MYTLYVSRNSAGMGAHAMLEELGAPFETVAIDTSKPRTPEYLAINPTGRIPSLVEFDDAGSRVAVVFQSAAILCHLADRHPEAKFLGPVGGAARARSLQWLWFMAEALQPAYLMHFHPDGFTADPSGQAAIDAKATDLIDAAWAIVDGAIGAGSYLGGTAPEICDFYFLTFALWHKAHHRPLAAHPNLARALRGMTARPAVRRMMAASGKNLQL